MKHSELIPYRIRIGVTGHRKIPDFVIDKIRKAIEYKIYDLYDEKSKNTIIDVKNTPIALSIITPLAEGADRLVAYEVLKTKEIFTGSKTSIPIIDTRLEAVLPMRKADYLEDFDTAESISEFEELISKSRRPISLKENLFKDEIKNGDLSEARNQAYLDVGRYVVDNCDVLIALWNGQPAAGKGGTAEIVDYAIKKKRPVLIVSTLNPEKDIEVIKGNGLNAGSLINLDFFNSYKMNEDSKKRYIENIYNEHFENEPRIKTSRKSLFRKIQDILENIFYYRSFSRSESNEVKKTEEDERKDIEKINIAINSISTETKQLIRDKLIPYYARASSISKKYQRKYLRAGTTVYTFSALSALLISVVILNHQFSIIIFPIVFLLLLIVYVIVTIADKKSTRKRWVENRFLAERIRSSIFLVICGTEVSQITIPPYRAEALKVDDWMVIAFDEIWKGLPSMQGCHENLLENCSEYVRVYWIEDQIRYNNNKSFRSGKKNKFFENAGLTIFFIAVFVALLHSLNPIINIAEDILLAIVIILPAMGAAAGGIRAHREYSRIEKRSRNMVQPLEEFKEALETMDDTRKFEITLRNIEKLMLDETQDWLMIMRFVDLKPEA